MLELKNISKRYKNAKVLNGINLFLNSSGIVYIVGNSGSGKSTLLNILGGIDTDYDGEYLINDTDFKTFDYEKKRTFFRRFMSFSFQKNELENDKTVFENIALSLELDNIASEQIKEEINKSLNMLGMLHLSSQLTTKISGGEKKRVGLLRALIKEAKIYLLDEPFNGLDPILREKVMALLQEKAKNHLVVIITHQEDEICKFSTVYRIKDGNIELEHQDVERLCTPCIIEENTDKEPENNNITKDVRRKLSYHKRKSIIAISAITVGLICFGIASFLVGGVKDSIVESLTSNINQDAILIESKEKKLLSDEKRTPEVDIIESIKATYTDLLESFSYYYTGDITALFPNKNSLSFIFNGKESSLPNMGLNDLMNVINYDEIMIKPILDLPQLSLDEIAIGVDRNTLAFIASIMNIEYDLEAINRALVHTPILLNLSLKNSSWRYEAEVIYSVKRLIGMPSFTLIHTDHDFLLNLFEEELQLETTNNHDSPGLYPWTVRKKAFFRVKIDEEERFVREFYSNQRYKKYEVFPQMTDSLQEENNVLTRRYAVISLIQSRDGYDEIISKLKKQDFFRSYSSSSSFYLFGEEGLFAGFLQPFFIAKNKELINQLIDSNYYGGKDQDDLLGASMILPEKVIGGDLTTNIKQKGFIYETLDKYHKLKSGRLPTNINEIVISSALCTRLELQNPLMSLIHFASLIDVTYENSIYKNNFKDGSFKVVGIIEDSKMKLYQDENFLQSFSLIKLGRLEGTEKSKLLVRFNLTKSQLIGLKEKLQESYDDFFFSIPSQTVIRSIEPMMLLITSTLFFFAGIALLIAVFLLSFIVTLSILEELKTIGTKLAFGYTLRSIKNCYYLFASIIALLSATSAGTTMALIQVNLKGTFQSILGGTIPFSIIPIITIFFLSIVVSLLSSYFATKRLDKVTIVDIIRDRD